MKMLLNLRQHLRVQKILARDKNSKGNNVKQYLMLKYNNAKPSQRLQRILTLDISLALLEGFLSTVCYSSFVGPFTLLIFVSFQQKRDF